MKSVCVFLCLVVVTLASVQERYNQVHLDCQSNPDLYVDDAIFEKLKKGENPTLPPNFGDHAFCMLKNLDLQDDEGNVIEHGVRQAVAKENPENSEKIVQDCSSIDEDGEDVTAIALFGCLSKYRINIGQL